MIHFHIYWQTINNTETHKAAFTTMASTTATLCHSHGGSNNVPLIFTDEEQIPSPPPPPPTPCNHSLSTDETDTFLSHLLTRLSLPPPALTPVLPMGSKQKTMTPPVISLHEPNRELVLSAATELGFFHVSDHDIPFHLHEMWLQNYQSKLAVSTTSDISYRGGDDGEHIRMFEPDGDDEFARELERVGLKVLELLFEDWVIGTERRSLLCVFPNKMKNKSIENAAKEQLQSCILQLTYEGRGNKLQSAVVNDSGKSVPVEARGDMVRVTIGEVSQVWSSGRFKKLWSLPQPSPSSLHQSKDNELVTLLITVPVGGIVTNLTPKIKDTNTSS